MNENIKARVFRIVRSGRLPRYVCALCEESHPVEFWDLDIGGAVCGCCRDALFRAEKALVCGVGLSQPTDSQARSFRLANIG